MRSTIISEVIMIRSLIALLLTPLFVCAAPTLKNKPAAYYYATTVGDTFVYETKSGLRNSERTEKVESVQEKDGELIVTTVRTLSGKELPGSKVKVSDKGLIRLAAPTKGSTEPLILIKLPAKAGETWETKVEGPIQKYVSKMVGEEEVVVPAGKYKALRVEMTYMSGGEEVKTTSWYAPGIGMVKAVLQFGTSESVQELKSFTPGKK
jgi:hypothetical protein